MNLTKFLSPFLLIALFCFSSCGDEEAAQQKMKEEAGKKPVEIPTEKINESPKVESIHVADIQKAIIGRWEVEEAYRGKSKTESIDGAFYEFGEDGLVASNLLGSDTESNKYSIEDKKIITEGPFGAIDIVDMDESNLSVTFNMRDTDFKLILKKAE